MEGHDAVLIQPRGILGSPTVHAPTSFTLSNVDDEDQDDVIFDYGCCEGGVPVFHIENASGPEENVLFKVTYSETRAGIDHEKGSSALETCHEIHAE